MTLGTELGLRLYLGHPAFLTWPSTPQQWRADLKWSLNYSPCILRDLLRQSCVWQTDASAPRLSLCVWQSPDRGGVYICIFVNSSLVLSLCDSGALSPRRVSVLHSYPVHKEYVTEWRESLDMIENVQLHCNLGSLSERLSLSSGCLEKHPDQTITSVCTAVFYT